MNPLQMAQQIKHELETVVWADGSGDVVFGDQGSVLVYAGAVTEDEIAPGLPMALVTIDTGTADESHPEFLEQTFGVIVLAEAAGGPMGEFAVIGGVRPDLGKSAGAGVAEVAERVRSALQKLTGADGAKVLLSASATAAPQTLGEGRHMAFDELSVTAFCTSQPHYAAPQQLTESSDTWTWKGAHCTERFDFVQFRLGYKTGSTPPATPAECNAFVYTGSDLTTSHVPVAGRVYAIFADYNTRGGATVHNSSPGSLIGTYVAK